MADTKTLTNKDAKAIVRECVKTPCNRKVLIEVLKDEYDTIEASNGREALDIINKNPATISLVLLDILMPEMTGLEVLRTLSDTGISSLIPVILITAADTEEEYGLNLGAVDFITKPFDTSVVKTRVKNHMRIKNSRDMLEELVSFNMSKTENIWEATIEMLANIIEFRSFENFKNYDRIKTITRILIDRLLESDIYTNEINSVGVNFILTAAPLCDMGKIFVPEYILFKGGKLTDDEFEIVKKHTINGAKIIKSCLRVASDKYVKCCEEVCLNHHENWDGSGYPDNLKEYQIPLSAQIVAVIERYCSLTDDNINSREEALEIMKKEAGVKINPDIFDICCKISRQFC